MESDPEELYLDEPDSDAADKLLASDPGWVTARHTAVEVRRNLAKALSGRDLARAREQFAADWLTMAIVELDEATCDVAASLSDALGVRTLDALHLGAAQRLAREAMPFLTFDLRQAQAARSLGWTVLGA